MGTSMREAEATGDAYLLALSKKAPLQSLTDKELGLDQVPVTIYPRPVRARAWVRFGPAAARVDCQIVRTTSTAAGIMFTLRGTEFRCWVWGNAVTTDT